MKRREFVRGLVERGCYLKRHGANHDIYLNPANGRVAPVPRHNEIKEHAYSGDPEATWLGIDLDRIEEIYRIVNRL